MAKKKIEYKTLTEDLLKLPRSTEKLTILIDRARQHGHKINYRVRQKDNSIVITSIDGMKFKSNDGNKMLRIISAGGKSGARKKVNKSQKIRKYDDLPKSVKTQYEKTLAEWKKSGKTGKSTINKRTLIAAYNREGAKITKTKLKRQEHYALGFAPPESVEAIAEMITNIGRRNPKVAERAKAIANRMLRNKWHIKEDMLEKVHELIYTVAPMSDENRLTQIQLALGYSVETQYLEQLEED